MVDAQKKGRLSTGARHSAVMLPKVQHGEERPLAKLTDSLVRSMREMRSRRGVLFRDIARAHGVNYSTAYRAVMGLTWRHVA